MNPISAFSKSNDYIKSVPNSNNLRGDLKKKQESRD